MVKRKISRRKKKTVRKRAKIMKRKSEKTKSSMEVKYSVRAKPKFSMIHVAIIIAFFLVAADLYYITGYFAGFPTGYLVAAGGNCTDDSECDSGFCDPSTSKCAEPTCSERGGVICSIGETCEGGTFSISSDSPDGLCCIDGGICAALAEGEGEAEPTCTDGIQNQDETDIDCGGLTCDPCATGKKCKANDDCTTGSCADNICASVEAGTGGVCGPGVRACVDETHIKVCQRDGNWGPALECPSTKPVCEDGKCVESGTAPGAPATPAVQKKCTYGERKCIGKIAWICSEDESKWETETCDYKCEAGFCIEAACEPEGRVQCLGSLLQVCSAGKWVTMQICPYGCDNETFVCKEKPSCSDSDGGSVPEIKGTTRGIDQKGEFGEEKGEEIELIDECNPECECPLEETECITPCELTEYYCINYYVRRDAVICEYGCRAGSCIPAENVLLRTVKTAIKRVDDWLNWFYESNREYLEAGLKMLRSITGQKIEEVPVEEELPPEFCFSDEDCPYDSYCDLTTGYCMVPELPAEGEAELGTIVIMPGEGEAEIGGEFCLADEECPGGYVCDPVTLTCVAAAEGEAEEEVEEEIAEEIITGEGEAEAEVEVGGGFCLTDMECSEGYCDPVLLTCIATAEGETEAEVEEEVEEAERGFCLTDEECPGGYCDPLTLTCVVGVGAGCSGPVSISLPKEAKPNTKIFATVSGLSRCNGKTVYIGSSCKNISKAVCTIEVSGEGGECEFKTPETETSYTYYACIDMDGDGSYAGTGESSSASASITAAATDIDLETQSKTSLRMPINLPKKINIGGNIHTITVQEVTNNTVKITIESEKQEIELELGESKEIDINGDKINDFIVKFNNIDEEGEPKLIYERIEYAAAPAEGEGEAEVGGEFCLTDEECPGGYCDPVTMNCVVGGEGEGEIAEDIITGEGEAEIGITKENAQSAISSASSIIAAAREEGRSITSAGNLLKDARTLFVQGKYAEAKAKAEEAKKAIGEKVAPEGGFPTLLIIVIIIVIGGAGYWYWKKKKKPMLPTLPEKLKKFELPKIKFPAFKMPAIPKIQLPQLPKKIVKTTPEITPAPPVSKAVIVQPPRTPVPEIRVKPELVDYVRRQFAAGYSSVGIKKVLMDHGHSEEAANAAIYAAKEVSKPIIPAQPVIEGREIIAPPVTRPVVIQPRAAPIPEIKVSSELVAYVKRQFSLGYPSIGIKKTLIDSGYTEGEANAAIAKAREEMNIR